MLNYAFIVTADNTLKFSIVFQIKEYTLFIPFLTS